MTTPRSRLRVIRTNVQALQRSLSHLAGPDDEFNARFPAEQVLWDTNAGEVDADLKTLAAQLERGEVKADIDDEVEVVKNAWLEATLAFKAFRAAPGAEDARKTALATIDDRLHVIVLKIGFLTIPQRVAEYVAQERSGGAVHFHSAFANELPLEADRVAVLQFLAESPGGLYGVVDVPAGLVWAVSRNGWRRWRGYIGSAVVLLVGLGVAAYAHDLAAGLGIGQGFADRGNLVAAYILVIVGVIGHIGVDVYKQSRTNEADSPAALDTLFLWGHIHELQMIMTAFGIWAGTVILAGLENPIPAWSAIVTGYSLDSVLDAGLRRFDTSVTKATQDLTATLADTGATP
jgi:hypothetical protein